MVGAAAELSAATRAFMMRSPMGSPPAPRRLFKKKKVTQSLVVSSFPQLFLMSSGAPLSQPSTTQRSVVTQSGVGALAMMHVSFGRRVDSVFVHATFSLCVVCLL